MAKKTIEYDKKMMDPNIIDYYLINCAVPSLITMKIVTKSILAKPGWVVITGS